MRTHSDPRYSIQSAPLPTAEFSVQAGAKAFKMMLDGIYTDKPLAVVREAIQNGYDATLSVGSKKAVHIFLPCVQNNHTLTVRDFGCGMTHDFMMDGYTRVTHSTKNDSDTSVGGLGIGRMSALTMCSSYIVTVYNGHTSRTYEIFLNDNAIPAITFIGESASTEPAGTQIDVAIPKHSVRDIIYATQRATTDFPVGAVVLFATPDSSPVDTTPVQYTHVLNTFGLRKPHPAIKPDILRVVMGPMAYVLDPDNLPSNFHDKHEKILSANSFDLLLKVGDVEVHPSRETIDYGSKIGLAALDKALTAAQKDVERFIQGYLDQYSGRFAKMLAYESLVKTGLISWREAQTTVAQFADQLYAIGGKTKFGLDVNVATRLGWYGAGRGTNYLPTNRFGTEVMTTPDKVLVIINNTADPDTPRKLSVFKLVSEYLKDKNIIGLVVQGAYNKHDMLVLEKMFADVNTCTLADLSYLVYDDRLQDNSAAPSPTVARPTYPALSIVSSTGRSDFGSLDDVQQRIKDVPDGTWGWIQSYQGKYIVPVGAATLQYDVFPKILNTAHKPMIIVCPTSHIPGLTWLQKHIRHVNEIILTTAFDYINKNLDGIIDQAVLLPEKLGYPPVDVNKDLELGMFYYLRTNMLGIFKQVTFPPELLPARNKLIRFLQIYNNNPLLPVLHDLMQCGFALHTLYPTLEAAINHRRKEYQKAAQELLTAYPLLAMLAQSYRTSAAQGRYYTWSGCREDVITMYMNTPPEKR